LQEKQIPHPQTTGVRDDGSWCGCRGSPLGGLVGRVKAVAEPPHSKVREARHDRRALQGQKGPREGGRYAEVELTGVAG
jgi:hypothetical protein